MDHSGVNVDYSAVLSRPGGRAVQGLQLIHSGHQSRETFPVSDTANLTPATEKPRRGPIVFDAITPNDHRALMARIAGDKDRNAFAALFGHFGPRVKAYLMRSGSNAESAEELAQEAMMTVWRRAESFDPAQASVATWIFTIARNKRIDVYRRSNRPEFDPEDPALSPQAEPEPDEVMGAAQTAAAIQTAVRTLPKEQAEMLHMAFFQDKAHSEIAEETGLPLGTVKSRLRLAIARMRKNLKESEL